MELSPGHPAQHPEVPPADRAEITDALHRYATGIDLHDRQLFESAFATDATLDFTSPARGLETTVPILEGRGSIGDAVMASTAPLITSHAVFNLRVTAYDGGHATATALVEEHYFQKGSCTGQLVLMNVYLVELWRESRRWLITPDGHRQPVVQRRRRRALAALDPRHPGGEPHLSEHPPASGRAQAPLRGTRPF